MSNIQQILEKEKSNDKHIRLYRIDGYWLAFERSAFNLFSVCNVDAIFKIKDVREEGNSILIVIVKDGEPCLFNPHFTVLDSSENEVLIVSRTICKGFAFWKDSLIPRFRKNIHPVSEDDIPHMFQYLNLEMLLC